MDASLIQPNKSSFDHGMCELWVGAVVLCIGIMSSLVTKLGKVFIKKSSKI